jgi:hypothetical protein
MRFVAFGLAVAGLLGAAIFMVRFAILARRVADLPTSMRLNPFNVLASRHRWTPEMEAVERKAAAGIAAFIAGVVLFALMSVLGSR